MATSLEQMRDSNMGRIGMILAACLTGGMGTAAWGGEIFYDHAPVLDVGPVMETERVPVEETVCHGSSSGGGDHSAGDVRALEPGLTMAEAIRSEQGVRRAMARRCRLVTRYQVRERVAGYRVTYRYADETFVKRMRNNPGERVQVRVELDSTGQRFSDGRRGW